MYAVIYAVALVSLQEFCLAVALPPLSGLPRARRPDQQCVNGNTKRWRHDVDIEVQTCWTMNGNELVKPSEMSEEDKDDIMKLYPGLLKSDDEINGVPLTQGVSVVPLDLASQSGLPSAAGLSQNFGIPGLQTIGLTPNVAIQRGASRASPASASARGFAASARTAAAFSGSGCCDVTRQWTRPSVLENINGSLRTLVHFPSRGVYQYINEGRCRNEGSGCAGGQCYTEKVTQYLAVFLPEIGENVIGFEAFSVNSHCICLNIGK